MESHYEAPIHFSESKTKQKILNESYPYIAGKLDKFSSKSENPSIEIITFGMVFEELAVREHIANRKETAVQAGARQIIEDAFKNSRLLIGLQLPPSTPDFVSVVFDPSGKLVIDEVLDMKTSVKAMRKSADSDQPLHTLETLSDVVDIINRIIKGEKAKAILPKQKIKSKHFTARIDLLKRIQNQVDQLGITEEISFSENLAYIAVLPEESKPKSVDENSKYLLFRNKKIEKKITNSQFSKRDIHKIIDHYAETT